MTDTERINWLGRAGDVDISVIQDAPHDGEFSVRSDFDCGYGKTIREAIDSVIHSTNKEVSVER